MKRLLGFLFLGMMLALTFETISNASSKELLTIQLQAPRGPDHETPLRGALRFKRFETAETLIKLGASTQKEMVHCGDTDTCAFLLNHGAKIDSTDETGQTPLHHAVTLDGDVVKFLLAKGANPNVSDLHGTTPLMVAVQGCKPEIVEQLLSKGCDVDARDAVGRTALMLSVVPCAVYQSIQLRHRSVELLLNAGANPDIVDKLGYSARWRMKQTFMKFSEYPYMLMVAEIKRLFDKHPSH